MPETPAIGIEIEQAEEEESRFGDKNKIVEVMTNGNVEIIGSIDDLFEDIPAHANEVNLARLINPNANQVIAVKVQNQEGESITCIFKPAKGENEQVKRTTNVKEFYPRECAAYLISEHFGFDVVPPTIIRSVNGEIGALQLFLDHDRHMNYSQLEDTGEPHNSEDWGQIAVLDWLLANCERHMENMMVDRNDHSKLFAIDHGIILNGYNYSEMILRGPSLQLTMECVPGVKRGETRDIPKKNPIPESILEKLHQGLENQQFLTDKLAEIGIPEAEIQSFWSRVRDICQSQIYLSKYNYRQVMGRSFLGSESS